MFPLSSATDNGSYVSYRLKSLGVGRTYLIKGDGTRALLRVHHQPTTTRSVLSPTIPRKWCPGDRERFGQTLPPIDLAQVLAPRTTSTGA